MRFTVQSARSNDLGVAFRMLAAFRPLSERDRAAERYRELFASGELDPAGLFVARDEAGAIRGAILVQVMPGALGLTWPPVTDRRNRAAIEDALVGGACDWLRSRGVKVCQAFASQLERDCMRIVRMADVERTSGLGEPQAVTDRLGGVRPCRELRLAQVIGRSAGDVHLLAPERERPAFAGDVL